ncbi:hypothetical protein CDEN61S_00058 [Castellaniella denitrificans]
MNNPYSDLPEFNLHSQIIKGRHPSQFDPIVDPRFGLTADTKIMTMGSCFAQHLSKWLLQHGYNLSISEKDVLIEEGGVYSANYGNVYTVAQALQLFNRAFEKFKENDTFDAGENGNLYDPIRPSAYKDGFKSVEEALVSRAHHKACVKKLFLESEVLVFTLGLTEAWIRNDDHAVLPIAPGIAAGDYDSALYTFHNYTYQEIAGDLNELLCNLHEVNSECKVVLTISPVPLAATYEKRHVAVSTMASKSILRAVIEDVLPKYSWVDYFPSYELFYTPGVSDGRFMWDGRHVKPASVAQAMSLFEKHYLLEKGRDSEENRKYSANDNMADYLHVACDEEKIG